MYCGKCKAEIDHLLDNDGIDYIQPCKHCMKMGYKEGVRNGFYLAGGDIDDLPPIYKEKE